MMKFLLSRPLLFVTLIVAASVLLNVIFTLIIGSDISARSIGLPLIISAFVGSFGVGFVRKCFQNASALETQFELLDQVADSLGFAVDIIDQPNALDEVLGGQVHQFLNEPLERQLTFADLLDRIHPDDLDKFASGNEDFFDTDITNQNSAKSSFECRVLRTPGEYRHTRVTRVVSVFKGQRICYVQYSDIHELKQRTDQLQALAEDRADNLVTVSHEMRTPLNAIMGLSDLMVATRLNKTQQEYLSKIHAAADGLETLVRNLLDLRRLDSGQLEVEPETVATEDLLNGFVLLHQTVAEKSGLRFMVDFAPNLPKKIMTDGHMLEQIVNNLLRNAVKFTSDGMVLLSASYKEHTAASGDLFIDVSDTGSGIDKAERASLFMPFQRGSARNRQEGAGLGLALVKRLCELLQGEVSLKSELGIGSKFTVRIPVTVVDADPIIDPDGLDSIADLRVLLVERRSLPASHISSVLKTCVQSVRVVVDLNEAAKRLHETDVVLIGHAFDLSDLEHFAQNCDSQRLPDLRLVAIAKLETLTSRLFSLVAGVVVAPFSLKQFVSILASEVRTGSGSWSQGVTLSAEVSSLLLLKGLRVLVAEDNEINQHVIKENLNQRGALVTLAGDGKQAIDALMQADYDLILMDIEMPVLNGFEAAERIKAQPVWKNIPIIPVSAGVTATQKARAQAVGMEGFVGKPYKMDELVAAIESVLVDRDLAPAQTELVFDEDARATPSKPQAVEYIEFDYDEAKEYWPTTDALLENLTLFAENYPVSKGLFSDKTNADAAKLAHTLKGAAGFLGMTEYSHRLNDLTIAFKNESVTPDMLTAVEAQHSRVLAEVRAFLSMLS